MPARNIIIVLIRDVEATKIVPNKKAAKAALILPNN
jgi:hypothetical protein